MKPREGRRGKHVPQQSREEKLEEFCHAGPVPSWRAHLLRAQQRAVPGSSL